MRPAVFPHPPFPDHALLDSGGGEKLERFGPVVLRRPDPQALWRPALPPERWAAADLAFERESDRGGVWVPRPGGPAPAARGAEPAWPIRFGPATLVVRPTPFKHVGVFPEQAANWVWLAERARELRDEPEPRLLNLFGYTGAASVLAALDGWSVTHVDASRTSVAWTVENAVASGLSERALRVIVDDALAFARREARRGARYHAVLLDPPHHGRGPKGERWRFETGIAPLVEAVGELLAERALVVVSTYAIGFSPLALENLLGTLEGGVVEAGELALPEERAPAPRAEVSDVSGRRLPAGFCARWSRGFAPPGAP